MNGQYRVAEPIRATALERELLPSVHALGLALRNYRAIGRKGDLVAFLTEMKIEAGGKVEPVLMLANSRAPRERQVAFPLKQLWLIREDNILRIVSDLAKHLYGFVTKNDEYRVLDALLEFGEDLKNAPTPTWIPEKEWLVAVGRDGFVITHDGEAMNE